MGGFIRYFCFHRILYCASNRAILLGLILGVVIENTILLSEDNQQTVNRLGSNFLEFSIVLLAFGINYQNLLNLGWQTLLVILLIVFYTLMVTYF